MPAMTCGLKVFGAFALTSRSDLSIIFKLNFRYSKCRDAVLAEASRATCDLVSSESVLRMVQAMPLLGVQAVFHPARAGFLLGLDPA